MNIYNECEIVLFPSALESAVSEYFNCDAKRYIVSSRKMELTFIRHILRHFLVVYTDMSYDKIARSTCSIHHTTTWHSHNKILDWLEIGDQKTENAVVGITHILLSKFGYALLENVKKTVDKKRKSIENAHTSRKKIKQRLLDNIAL